MEETLPNSKEERADASRSPLALVLVFLGSMVAGLVLTAVLSGAVNFGVWLSLTAVTPLRGDTWEFWVWSGVIMVAAVVGAIAGPIGAFVGSRRGSGFRLMVLGALVAILLVVAAAIVLFLLAILGLI